METKQSSQIIGIDLGTTNSAVGLIDSGFPILLADERGERLTPSVVWYPRSGSNPVVGLAAERSEAREADRVVRSVKSLMGRDREVRIELDSGSANELSPTPEAVSAKILGKLRSIAESAQGQTISRAVVTVPAYFNDRQRNATKRAAEMAGLKVERILNEPTAAALAYGLDRLEEKSRIAVYDFGGGTFDVSILELNEGVFQVLATNGDTSLGGDDLDAVLSDWVVGELQARGSAPIGSDQRWVISEAASRAKVELSSNASTTLRFPFIEKGKTFEVELTRDRFEGLIEKTIRKTVGCCRRAMSDAGMAPEDLDEVILVGGTTRIPAVRRLVEEVYLKTPNISQNPDEAVAIGAAIQAGILEGAVQKMVLLDVTPLSLGIETFGGLMNVIIPRNTTIPAKAGEMFTNAAAGQESLLVRVLQGERELAKDNWRLGEFVLPFEPGPKGSARVGVQFKIDENGILEILMRDQHRKLDQVFEIEDVVIDVDDSAVESMIEESIEFAFDDLAERKHVELRQKAEELISSVDIALEKLGDKLGQTVRDQILEAASATRQCLDQRDDERLPGAINHLEKVTDPVAALLLERLLDVADDR